MGGGLAVLGKERFQGLACRQRAQFGTHLASSSHHQFVMVHASRDKNAVDTGRIGASNVVVEGIPHVSRRMSHRWRGRFGCFQDGQ